MAKNEGNPEESSVLYELRERAALEGLWQDPDETKGAWEIVKITSVDSDHVAYGFRAPYNDLIAGGLTSLDIAGDTQEI